MEKVIQLIQAVHGDASAVAWLAMGVLLFAGVDLGILALFWIFGGGIGVRSTQELLAQQRQVAQWLREKS
jgi:hypothetical protein